VSAAVNITQQAVGWRTSGGGAYYLTVHGWNFTVIGLAQNVVNNAWKKRLMFEHLRHYNQILVTGPQRSGTRIAAKMIAADTDYRYVDETEFGVHSHKKFRQLIGEELVVVQCPGMCHVIHNYSTEDNLIVMMMRDVDDILASEQRIGWFYGIYDELLKYSIPYDELHEYAKTGRPVSELKYEMWENEQYNRIFNYCLLEYESLSEHSLWIPKALRADFTPVQTE